MKTGRPKVKAQEKRGVTISIRLKPDEYKLIQDAIRASEKNQSEWIRNLLLLSASHSNIGNI